MGGPIGHGVLRGSRNAQPSPPASPLRAWLYFVLATTCLSWLTVAAVGPSWAPWYHVAVLGWQPLVGAWLAGLVQPDGAATARPARPALELGIVLILAVAVVAGALLLTGPMDRERAIAGLAALAVLGVGAVSGRYGWRGVPLRCAIARWGPAGGAVLHGLTAVAWAAPLLIVAAMA